MILFCFFFILAYLLGSINCAIIVAKLFGLEDPRQQGSRNPGATNVMRIGGKKAAAIVFIGDVLKGVVPILLASLFSISGFWLALIGLAAVIGHMYPIFFGFRGGKGVATAFGVMFSLSIWLGIITLIIFAIVLICCRYVSLASIIAIGLTPVVAIVINMLSYFIPLMLIAILVVWRHNENLSRLLAGTESRLSRNRFKI